MLVIAFGIFLILPLVLLVASLIKTVAGGEDRSGRPAATVPAPSLVAADPVEAAPKPRAPRFRRRGDAPRTDFFGDAVASGRLRNAGHTPGAVSPVATAHVAETTGEAPLAPRPVVIPAPAPVFGGAVQPPAFQAATSVQRPIAPAATSGLAELALRS